MCVVVLCMCNPVEALVDLIVAGGRTVSLKNGKVSLPMLAGSHSRSLHGFGWLAG